MTGPAPIAQTPAWSAVMATASRGETGPRCQCQGQCGQAHAKGAGRCPRLHGDHAKGGPVRLVAAPADPTIEVEAAMFLRADKLRAWCPSCHDGARRTSRKALAEPLSDLARCIRDGSESERTEAGIRLAAANGTGMARVGLDAFAANVIGNVQQIVVVGEQRWVRQGQKLITLTGPCETIEMFSPLEGVVAAINPAVIRDPGLALHDPYGKGWVCQIKSSEMETNRRNLMHGSMAARWLENSFTQLKSMLAEADAVLAQDGGLPLHGAFSRLSPQQRKQLVKEFFLS